MASSRKVLVASTFVYILANFAWWMQPQILSSLISGLAIEQSAAGAVVAVELIAIAAASFVMAYYLHRFDLRKVAYTMGVTSIVAHTLCIFTESHLVIVAFCVIAGLAEGFLLAIANAAIAGSENSERSYSLMNVACVFSGFIVLALAPFVADAYSYQGIFGWLAFASMLTMPFFGSIPRQIDGNSSLTPLRHSQQKEKTGLGLFSLLVGMFVWGTVSGAVWAFFVVFGERTSLDPTVVGFVSSMAAVGGLIGGIAMTKMSEILPRVVSIAIGLVFQSCMALILANSANDWVFILCAPAVLAGVYYILPYFLGVAAQLDRSGSYPAAVCGMFVLTGGTGGLYGGLMIERFGLVAIGWSVLGGSVVAFLAMYVCVNIAKKKTRTDLNFASC